MPPGASWPSISCPSGPWGGLAGMVLANDAVEPHRRHHLRLSRGWPARSTIAPSSPTLLGPAWIAFEVAYILFVVLILAVFGASAGAIGAAMFGWPSFVGAVLLAVAILATVSLGNAAVERVFKYVSFLLYGVYALFLILGLVSFGDRIAAGFATPAPCDRLGVGRAHLCQLQHHRRGRDPAGAAPPHQHARRSDRRRDRRPAGDAAGDPVLRLHGRLLSRHRRRDAAFGLPAPPVERPGLPLAVPDDDLRRACSKAVPARSTRSTSASPACCAAVAGSSCSPRARAAIAGGAAARLHVRRRTRRADRR